MQFSFKPMVQWSLQAICCLKQRVVTAISRGKCNCGRIRPQTSCGYLYKVPPRIARVMLRIQKYDAKIRYVPGKDIPVADALSGISFCHGEALQGLDVSVHGIRQNFNASLTRVSQKQEETAKDPTLWALREVIMGGWPES